jgi:hypothetical protein
VVAKAVWNSVNDFLQMEIGDSYISVASKWLHRERFYSANIITFAVLRGLWLTRNDHVFQNQVSLDVKTVLRRILRLTVKWRPIFKQEKSGGDEEMVIFFGGADLRVIGDRKCLKLTKKFTSELLDECAPIRG